MDMMALSSGGRRAATCKEWIPPQEIPRMPTAPFHQGCRASQAMQSSASRNSGSSYSSVITPSESPVPRISMRANAIPNGARFCAVASSRLRTPSRLRYGRYSSTTGTGCASAPSGIHSRTARRAPSGMGIHSFSITRTARFAGRFHELGGLPASWGAAADGSARMRATSLSVAIGAAASVALNQSRLVIPIGRSPSSSIRDTELVRESQARSPGSIRRGEFHRAGRADEDLSSGVGQVLNIRVDLPCSPIGTERGVVGSVTGEIVIRAAECALSDHVRNGVAGGRGRCLHVPVVIGDRVLVTRPQIALERRRVGQGGAGAVGREKRDDRARAADEGGIVQLAAAVPCRRGVEGQLVGGTPDDIGLDAAYPVVRA